MELWQIMLEDAKRKSHLAAAPLEWRVANLRSRAELRPLRKGSAFGNPPDRPKRSRQTEIAMTTPEKPQTKARKAAAVTTIGNAADNPAAEVFAAKVTPK